MAHRIYNGFFNNPAKPSPVLNLLQDSIFCYFCPIEALGWASVRFLVYFFNRTFPKSIYFKNLFPVPSKNTELMFLSV